MRRLDMLASRPDYPIEGPALGAFIARVWARQGQCSETAAMTISMTKVMMVAGPPSTMASGHLANRTPCRLTGRCRQLSFSRSTASSAGHSEDVRHGHASKNTS
jgi:hypothetical protein